MRCGILANGFARVWCEAPRQDDVIAFSCKGRGVCPSCGVRRMVATAAYLVDHVIPDAPGAGGVGLLRACRRAPGQAAPAVSCSGVCAAV